MEENKIDRPILLDSLFPSWAIHHRFKNSQELEKWIDEYELEIISMVRFSNYIVVTAKSKDVEFIERIV